MPDTPEKRLATFGLVLPKLVKPLSKIVGHVESGGLLFISGQLPLDDGRVISVGKVGETVTEEEAGRAAELSALNLLAQMSNATDGDLSMVERIVRLTVYVNCTSKFRNLSSIADHASRIFEILFEEKGQHARTAIGVGALPRGASVEIDALVELRAGVRTHA